MIAMVADQGVEKSPSAPLKILVVRPDRIGDVILSTPVFEVLKRHYPRSHLTVMVREQVAPLVRGLAPVDEVMIYDPEKKHAGIGGLFALISEFRERGFRIAVVLHSQWKIAAALFAAGVQYRVGPRSKPHSFVFYNRGVRQHRSQVEMHEADYNLQLLRRMGIRVGTRNVPVKVSVSEEARADARRWLEERGHVAERSLIAVHPGMAGSALNWPENHYTDLIRALIKEGHSVLVTAGPAEGPLQARIQEALGPLKDKAIYYGGPESGTIDRLAALYSHAAVVIAPSTGPLHLAVALGRPVVTFFPPVRVMSAIRWGPYVAREEQASILVPEVYCGEEFKCLGNLCNYYPCMRSLTVPQALEEVHRQLSKLKEPSHG
jgi:lipopolysaccharide heptosyltransferase II